MGTFVPLKNTMCDVNIDLNKCLDCIDLQIKKGECKDCKDNHKCENIWFFCDLLGVKFGFGKTPKWAYIKKAHYLYKVPFKNVFNIQRDVFNTLIK